MAADPSCSPGLPSSGRRAQLTPRGKGLGGDFPRFAQIHGPKMSSLPPPAGRGAENQLSPYMEPPAWGWGPKASEASGSFHTPSLSTSLQVPCLLMKVGQPFLPLREMQTEGPASLQTLLSSRCVDPITTPTPQQPRACWGSLGALKDFPYLSLIVSS